MMSVKLLLASPFLLLRLLIAIVLIFVVLLAVLFVFTYCSLFCLQTITRSISNAPSTPKYSDRKKHALVTGGSSGIGLEVARAYLLKGYYVTIVARNETKLKEAFEDLKKSFTTSSSSSSSSSESVANYLQYVSCDVSSGEENVLKCLSPALTKFGEVDVLVNSAGTSIAGTFDTLNEKEFERMYRVNVLGSIYPTRVVLPGMKKRKSGNIIFVCSQVAQVCPTPFVAVFFLYSFMSSFSYYRQQSMVIRLMQHLNGLYVV
jgi:short-subunit dehydrogenase